MLGELIGKMRETPQARKEKSRVIDAVTVHVARGCIRVAGIVSKMCYYCNQTGHLARECSKAIYNQIECFKYRKLGHYARDFLKGNNENEKVKATCTYCRTPGHHYNDCYKRLNKVAESR